MADFRYQWPPSVLSRERYNIVLIFNVALLDLARQAAPSSFAIVTFMVSTLLTFIQIKFPATGTQSFPFDTHHTKFMVAMLSLLGYCCFAIVATQDYWFPTHTRKLRMAMKLTASLLVASLVSLLLPKPWDRVPYVTYFLYFTGHGLGFVRDEYLAYYHSVVDGFVRTLRELHRRLTVTRPPLPVTVSVPNIPNQPIANRRSIMEVRTFHQ
ncbi:hypothetical protein ACLB2K_001113 [Fragaria x ananassa]